MIKLYIAELEEGLKDNNKVIREAKETIARLEDDNVKIHAQMQNIGDIIFPTITCDGDGARDEHYMHTVEIGGYMIKEWDKRPSFTLANRELVQYLMDNYDNLHHSIWTVVDQEVKTFIKLYTRFTK